MNTLILNRFKEDEHQTLGNITIYDNTTALFSCKSLELPWRDNQKYISRIPSNHYPVVKHTSPKFGRSLWIQDVPDRSEILIHVGNFYEDILGCILVGEEFYDIDNNGLLDVTNSRKTVDKILNIVTEPLYINIIEEWN